MRESSLLHMTAPLREDFDVPCHDIGAELGTPRVALVAGIHGNELNGVFVLARLAAYLREVHAGERPGQSLRARVIVIPAGNVLGINTRSRHWPFDGTDINRMFPGYDAGETTQRLAHAIFAATKPAHYRVDIHSSNLDLEELPQLRLYDPIPAEREHAVWFALPAVVERPVNTVFTNTIGHAWRCWGGENYVIQAGQAGYLQHRHCERLFRGLVTFLEEAQVLHGTGLHARDLDVHQFGLAQSCPLVAEQAGMFVSTLKVGRWLRAGEVVGYVYDAFNGAISAEIKTPVNGLLTALRRQPLLFEGDLIARLHTREPSGGGDDRYLHTTGQ